MINKLRNIVMFLAISAMLSSCVGFSYDIPSNITVEKGKGVVLLSTGAQSKSASSARNLLIKNSAGRVVESLHIDNFALKSHFEDHIGFVHAVNLEEGEYEINLDVLNIYLEAKNRNSAPKFSVKSGEIIYLGEIFLVDSAQLYRVSNKIDRDLPKLNSNGANLKREDITVSLIKL